MSMAIWVDEGEAGDFDMFESILDGTDLMDTSHAGGEFQAVVNGFIEDAE